MTVRDALKKYSNIEIELLLAFILGKTKEFLFLHPEYALSRARERKLALLARRRKKGEPVAYLLGKKEFYGRDYYVNRHVLIPRPETEELVDIVIASLAKQSNLQPRSPRPFVPRNDKTIKILDLGTGLGCIAITLAKTLPPPTSPYKRETKKIIPPPRGGRLGRGGFEFFASDISAPALAVAKKNAQRLGAKIKFIRSDLFARLPAKYDVIVANLPYVTKTDYKKGFQNLKWEPRIALTDGKNNWQLYQKFFQQLPSHLRQSAIIFLEIDPKSKKQIARWCGRFLPKTSIEFYRDLAGRWRFAKIQTNP